MPVGPVGSVTPTFALVSCSSGDHLRVDGYGCLRSDSATVAWFTPAQAVLGWRFDLHRRGAAPARAGPRHLEGLTWNPFGYGPWSLTATMIVDVPDGAMSAPKPMGPSGPIEFGRLRTWLAISGAITWYQLAVTDGVGEHP